MQIYIHRNNQQLGPFTEAEIKEQLASGAVTLQDNAWWEGQANWVPLGESSLAATLAPASSASGPAVPTPLAGPASIPVASATAPQTSTLAIWALVCGCLSLVCSIFASIPAIILGHMGLSQTKKNPALQGRGMALAGMILGYVFTVISVVYIAIVGLSVLVALGSQVKTVFSTISSQLAVEQGANGADLSTTSPDQTTNAADQGVPPQPATNSPDQSTNSAPASTNSPESSASMTAPGTNAPESGTNAAPMNP